MPATFFCEGRTIEAVRDSAGCLSGFEVGAHGYDHEPLSSMPRADAIDAVMRGCQAVEGVLGCPPVCFRAPYMRQPRDIGDFLRGTGIRADSSLYASLGGCRETVQPGGVAEIPVTEGRDAEGRRISAYLWPMHEDTRPPQDYVDLGASVPEDGIYVLADHAWHIVESRRGGVLSGAKLEENVANVRRVLEGILDAGYRPLTVSQAAALAR